MTKVIYREFSGTGDSFIPAPYREGVQSWGVPRKGESVGLPVALSDGKGVRVFIVRDVHWIMDYAGVGADRCMAVVLLELLGERRANEEDEAGGSDGGAGDGD